MNPKSCPFRSALVTIWEQSLATKKEGPGGSPRAVWMGSQKKSEICATT